jgi:pimeloyl-ACP methyl ester carboxylesterase
MACAVASCAAPHTSAVKLQPPRGLALEARGHGAELVLVHGALADFRQWRPITESLSRGFHVVALSRRFHWPNLTRGDEVGYTFSAHTADLAAFLRTLDRPAHLVGHSWGAGVTLLTALEFPELVRTLTLIEPPFGSVVAEGTPQFAGELASRAALVSTIAERVRAGELEDASEALINWVQGGAGGFRRLPPEVQDELHANAPTIGPTFATAPPQVTCEQIGRLRLPVLVLRGDRTRLWYRLIAEATACCIPDAESAQIPDAAHMVIVEQPRRTAELIRSFIARH